ncbi:isoleucine--tRNA ligase [Desulfothermus naphthae]
MKDYKDTLNLPRTKFPMKANLPKNEPKMLEFWNKIKAYEKMLNSCDDKKTFVLHDGPPYANGNIHLGTAMNKILKDIIVKYHNLKGEKAEFVPGWDCHGLPIELKVEQELKISKKEVPVIEIRERCRQYANKYLNIQREEFKRLGVFGRWEKPYITMDPVYEAQTAMELCNFMKNGGVIRSKKPIYWCPSCETALAEAEVEYYDVESPSIYVRFPFNDKGLCELIPEIDGFCYIVIWTTTPWTLPSNVAVAVHPEYEYAVVKIKDEFYILADRLLGVCAEIFGWENVEKIKKIKGSELEGLSANHPFYNRESKIVLADYVTLDTGTGCVHTAPGHGREDYETGLKYNLEILSPIDDCGRFLDDVEFFKGLTVFEANPKVIEKLQEVKNLLYKDSIKHSYPHCWRCRKPVIFRATLQWFISMEKNDLRKRSLDIIEKEVKWIPQWGMQRIYNMVATRPDWCISRQRSWGVPIIALICKKCGEAYFDPEWVEGIVKKFETHERGADYWFEASLEEIVPPGLKCKRCGSKDFGKETDILDVWFDSGTSFAAVLEKRKELKFPADLYLEGSDQHRGWFHSSLLASVGTRGVAPYKAVLTHGYVVDGEGRKMSKSLGNVIRPQEIIEKYGAEILRMWTSYEDYKDDIRISDKIISQLVDSYRKIRNTCRFILGNLSDFDPTKDLVPFNKLLPFDKYNLSLILDRNKNIMKAYDNYEFHKVYYALHNMCVVDLSSFYLDVIKERLYVSYPKSIERLSAQTVLYYILKILMLDMAPILSFTAEEIYQNLPEKFEKKAQTVFELKFEELDFKIDPEEKDLWDLVRKIKGEVTKAIEPKRKQGIVGHSLDCDVTLYLAKDLFDLISPVKKFLREIFIVSKVDVKKIEDQDLELFKSEEIDGLYIDVEKSKGVKCPRCWVYSTSVSDDDEYKGVCERCLEVLKRL